MGFRSTFTTEDYNISWPDWFYEKYQTLVFFREDRKGTIAARHEAKTYMDQSLKNLPQDIQRAINWDDFRPLKFVVVFLHECGGITRCQIEANSIKWSEPDSWRKEDDITHDECFGCSDVA